MAMKSELLAHFYGEYKTGGVFGKKNRVFVYLREDSVEGVGAVFFSDKFNERELEIDLKQIQDVRKTNVGGEECLQITFRISNNLVRNKADEQILFPNLEKIDEATRMIWEQKKKIEDAERRKRDEETQRKNQQLIEEQQREEECRLFYQDCYQFHIARHNRPYFELYRDGLLFQAIYLDEEKRLNFLQIDGYAHAENNGCVPYDKIHYYEKAGSVHYTTDINGSFSSFGGSFTGASVSKAAGIAGGLLFGPMGMMAGALLTYKPAEMKMPETSAQITSEAHRIDERSVILNYYSDVKQQLIDIELPADCYNFLQTYLPEKRHSIVMELEKETIKNVQGIETERPQIPEQKAVQIGTDESMEEFENRVKKLKIMYDNGLLSEEEFLNEKKKLLNF